MTLVAIAIVAVAFIVSSGGEDGTAAGPATSEATASSQATNVTTSAGVQETTSTSEAEVVETTATTTTSTTSTTAEPTTTTEASGFTEEFQTAYMDLFVSGGNRDFCRCALNEFEARYTETDLANILAGFVVAPADFSDASIACFDELPPSAPLPAFALPNTCTIEEWGVVVAYPSDWSVDETFGPCDSYVPDSDPSNTPVLFMVDATTTLDEIYAVKGDPEDTFSFGGRTFAVWVGDVGGTWWTDYFAPLWPDVPDGPVIWFALASNGEDDYFTVTQMMIKSLQVPPYTP